MTKQDLIKLRDKVAAGNRGDGLNTVSVFGDNNGPAMLAAEAFDGSVDAAIEFLEAVLPDWDWMSAVDAHGERYFVLERTADDYETEETYGDTPARALLLATLDALIEGTE